MTDPEHCPVCEDIMEPDDVTGEMRCTTDHPTPDNYDTLFVQRGAEEAFRIAADDARKLRAEAKRLREAVNATPQEIVVAMDLNQRYDDLSANERGMVRMTLVEIRRRAGKEEG